MLGRGAGFSATKWLIRRKPEWAKSSSVQCGGPTGSNSCEPGEQRTRIASDEAGTASGGMTVRSGRVRRFEIVFHPDSDEAPIPLGSVADADQATVAFHAQVQRLKRELSLIHI